MKTIEQELEDLSRGYAKTTKKRFMYNTEADLSVRCNTIVVYYLLYRETVGYTIFKCFYRRQIRSVDEWVDFLENESHEILVNVILPHLRKGAESDPGYFFKKLISWRFPEKADAQNPHAHGLIKFG